MSQEKHEQVPFRAAPDLMRLLRQCAGRHGRSVSEELRIAVELHVTNSLVELLPRPDVREKLGADAARCEDEVRARLARLVEHAYRPGKPEGLLESLLWIDERMPR